MSPSSGFLGSFDRIEVTIACHMNMPGQYKDTITVIVRSLIRLIPLSSFSLCQVDGLPPLHIPLRVGFAGSVLSVAPVAVGLNAKLPIPLLSYPAIQAGSGALKRTVTVVSHSPFGMCCCFVTLAYDLRRAHRH